MKKSIKAINNQAAALIGNQKYLEAQKILLKARRKYPRNPELMVNLASTYQVLGKPNQAVIFFKKALKLNPNYYQIYPRLWLQMRKVCQWDELEKIEKIIDKHPETETPFINMLRVEDCQKNVKIAKLKIRTWTKTQTTI